MKHVESFSEEVHVLLHENEENKIILQKITKPLLAWFRKEKRDLPWRNDPTGYHVWVSEIMLQQTRVEAVKGYYDRFLKALPEISDLAKADEEKLLKLWEGLGYYNRVRNMQKAAKVVIEEYNGELPADYTLLHSLPGIGSYTAGAIASIAYKIAVPAVDGNVLRVIMRILEDDSDIMKQSVKRQVEGLLLQVMSKEHPGEYNQALMELGATVCVPNGAPKCDACPVQAVCKGYANKTAEKYPVKTPKKQRRIEEKTVFVIVDGNNVILRKRDNKGLLAGLYELPNVDDVLAEDKALEWVKSQGLKPLYIEKLPDAKHIFSHVEWRMKGYLIRVYETNPGICEKVHEDSREYPFLVVEKEKIQKEMAIPSAFAAYRRYLTKE